jgi:hypothetical protein
MLRKFETHILIQEKKFQDIKDLEMLLQITYVEAIY